MTTSAVVEKPPLSLLVDAALCGEKVRVGAQVRLRHLENRGTTCPFTEELIERARRFEGWIDDTVADIIKAHPTYPWWSHIKGAGLENMAKVIGKIEAFGKWYDLGDPQIPPYVNRQPVLRDDKLQVWVEGIERLTMPSKLRKYSGFYPEAKRQRGRRHTYNVELKSMCYRLLISFMMSRNRYYGFYTEYHEAVMEKKETEGYKIIPTPEGKWCSECLEEKRAKKARFCPDCGFELMKKEEAPGVLFLGHIDAMAKRRTMQLFLDHLWAVWRQALGLPVTQPYPIEILGHHNFIDPWEMVDKSQRAGETHKQRASRRIPLLTKLEGE